MTRHAFAAGKIILSGEYAMGLIGARGIAMPSALGMTAIFEEEATLDGLDVDIGDFSYPWKQYLGKILQLAAESQGKPFRGRLWIQHDLPLGKGMGSSTALVIAVCRALLGDDCEAVARRIEGAMNPGHSGVDFAVIWADAPIIFRKGEEPAAPQAEPPLPHPLLIDTGTPEETTPELVAWVKGRMTEPAIKSALDTIGQCTERLLHAESPLTVFPDHSRAQVTLGVVPPEVQDFIARIEKAGGAAKVIGAGGRTGGGGMVLAIHPEKNGLYGVVPSEMQTMEL